jgi:ribosomal protein L40E
MSKLEFCESCGFKLSQRANFCPKCGSEAARTTSEPQGKPFPESEPTLDEAEVPLGDRSKRWIGISAFLGVALLVFFAALSPKTESSPQFSETQVLADAGTNFLYAGNGVAYSFSGVTCVYEMNHSCIDISLYTAQNCDDFEINLSFLDKDEVVVGGKKYKAGFPLAAGKNGKVFIDTRGTPGEMIEAQEITCLK